MSYHVPLPPHNILSGTHRDTDAVTVPAEGDSVVRRSDQWVPEAGADIGSDAAGITAVNFTDQGSDVAAPGAGHTILYLLASGVARLRTATTIYNLLVNVMTTLGDTLYGGASGALTRLAGNTTTTKKFLTQTGDGGNSAAPSWGTIAAADYPDMVGDGGAGGTKGAVPAPATGDATKFLKGDGTWATAGGSITVKEIDNAPSVAGVTEVRVTNGTLTDVGAGVVQLDFGSAATDGAAIHDNTASEIHAITEKTTPADADEILIEDSADSYNKKRVQISNLPSNGGSVATDTIWDAAGDLAVGSGANTATRLAKGTAYQGLRVNAGATTLEYGTPMGWKLAEILVAGSATGYIEFGSIPSGFMNLHILGAARTTEAAVATLVNMTLNGDTGNNYDNAHQESNNAAAPAASTTVDQASLRVAVVTGGNGPTNVYSAIDTLILDYSATDKTKACMSRSNRKASDVASGIYIELDHGHWTKAPEAITTVRLTPSAGSVAIGSRIALYGLL